MKTRISSILLIVGSYLLGMQAEAATCGNEPCGSGGKVRGNSVFPPDGAFSSIGERFAYPTTDFGITQNGARTVNLGFTVNFGSGPTDTLTVFENGFVALGVLRSSSLTSFATTGFVPITNLRELGIPVIAPFYSDLVQGSGAGDGRVGVGDIVVQFGSADPYPDKGGVYTVGDLRPAAKITWYGLQSASANCGTQVCAPVYAEMLITAENATDSNVEFRYGPDFFNPGQDAEDGLAGFAVGTNEYQFRGPFDRNIHSFFEFVDGRFVTDVTTPVPEPASWLQMIGGLALAGGLARMRRGRGRRTDAAPVGR